ERRHNDPRTSVLCHNYGAPQVSAHAANDKKARVLPAGAYRPEEQAVEVDQGLPVGQVWPRRCRRGEATALGHQTQTWTIRVGSFTWPSHSPTVVVTNLTSY